MKWGRKHCDPAMFDALNRSGGGKWKSWYVYFGTVKPDQFSDIEFLSPIPPKIVLAQLPDGRRRVVFGSGVAKAIMATSGSVKPVQELVAVSSEDEAMAMELALHPRALNPYMK